MQTVTAEETYIMRGRIATRCTLVDIESTYNRNGELVKTEQVVAYECQGQIVLSRCQESSILHGNPGFHTPG